MKAKELKPHEFKVDGPYIGDTETQLLFTPEQVADAIESAMRCADERARRVIYSDGGWGEKIAELRNL